MEDDKWNFRESGCKTGSPRYTWLLSFCNRWLCCEVDLDKINVGCLVKILDCEFDEELEYKIVGSTEANSLKGKISNESPVGRALLGHQIGDVVDVETQAGILQYKVLEIQRSNV